MIPGTYITEKQKIESEIERLKREADELQKRHRGPALASILEAMREYDISPKDVAAAFDSANKTSRRGGSRSTVAPKYQDPTSGQTWSGRGRTPRWLTSAEAQGRHRDEFLIKKP